MQWVRFQISQNHANTGEKYEIFTPNSDTIQEFILQYGCNNMHFILVVGLYLNLYYNAGNLGSNLKTKTLDIYFCIKKLAVTVLKNGVKALKFRYFKVDCFAWHCFCT